VRQFLIEALEYKRFTCPDTVEIHSVTHKARSAPFLIQKHGTDYL